MKNNQLIFILVGVFFLMTLGTVVLSYRFVTSMRTLQASQARLSTVTYTKAFLDQLGAEVREYSKKDPGINAMLQSVANTAPSNPAAMPPK